jgi:hypothetical protein
MSGSAGCLLEATGRTSGQGCNLPPADPIPAFPPGVGSGAGHPITVSSEPWFGLAKLELTTQPPAEQGQKLRPQDRAGRPTIPVRFPASPRLTGWNRQLNLAGGFVQHNRWPLAATTEQDMKPTPLKHFLELFHGPRAPATARRLACLALTLHAALSLQAAVMDDMSGPIKYLTGGAGLDYLNVRLVSGQMLFTGQYSGPVRPNNPLANWDNIYWPSSLPSTSQKGHTLEVRVDLIRTSDDDVFFMFGVENSSQRGYGLGKDKNEIFLAKYSSNINILFWDNAPTNSEEVTMVLSFTQTENTSQITASLIDKASGAILYQRSCTDGPGRDDVTPAVPPKGLTKDFFMPDPGAPNQQFGIAWAGLWDLRATTGPRIETVIDNLEYDLYDAPLLGIERSVLLSWSENTAEEQIVVGTDSLTGPWAPWPEPCFKRHGQVCMAVPTSPAQQYFKLVPGTQFIDDFSGAKQPWAPNFWEPTNASNWLVTNVNNTLRVKMVTAPEDGRINLFPPGEDVVVDDFWASVDIFDWDPNALTHFVGIIARASRDPVLDGYAAYVGLNYEQKGRGEVNFYKGQDLFGDPSFLTLKAGAKYRLCFSGVGNQLAVWLYDVDNLQQPIVYKPFTDSKWSRGMVLLNGNSQFSPSYRITLDNFFVTGTRP